MLARKSFRIRGQNGLYYQGIGQGQCILRGFSLTFTDWLGTWKRTDYSGSIKTDNVRY